MTDLMLVFGEGSFEVRVIALTLKLDVSSRLRVFGIKSTFYALRANARDGEPARNGDH